MPQQSLNNLAPLAEQRAKLNSNASDAETRLAALESAVQALQSGGGGGAADIAVRVRLNNYLSVAGASQTVLSWAGSTFQTSPLLWDGSDPTKLVIPTGESGQYLVYGRVGFQHTLPSATTIGATVLINASSQGLITEEHFGYVHNAPGASFLFEQSLFAGDYLRLGVSHTASTHQLVTPQDYSTFFGLRKVA